MIIFIVISAMKKVKKNKISLIIAKCRNCKGYNPLGEKEWTWNYFADEDILKMIKQQKDWKERKCFYDIKISRS